MLFCCLCCSCCCGFVVAVCPRTPKETCCSVFFFALFIPSSLSLFLLFSLSFFPSFLPFFLPFLCSFLDFLDSFSTLFRPPGPRGPGNPFSDFFWTLGPKGPNDPCSRRRRSQPKPKLLSPEIFRWGRGLPHEGVGAKRFNISLHTREIKLFWRDNLRFGWGYPGGARKV